MKPQLFYLGIKAVIIEDERLLLLKKRDPVFWDAPGGRIDPGETVMDALQRELGEELPAFTNYTVGPLIGHYHKEEVLADGNGLFLLYYLVKSTSNQNSYVLSSEHTEHRFFSRNQIRLLEEPYKAVYENLMNQSTKDNYPY